VVYFYRFYFVIVIVILLGAAWHIRKYIKNGIKQS